MISRLHFLPWFVFSICTDKHSCVRGLVPNTAMCITATLIINIFFIFLVMSCCQVHNKKRNIYSRAVYFNPRTVAWLHLASLWSWFWKNAPFFPSAWLQGPSMWGVRQSIIRSKRDRRCSALALLLPVNVRTVTPGGVTPSVYEIKSFLNLCRENNVYGHLEMIPRA